MTTIASAAPAAAASPVPAAPAAELPADLKPMHDLCLQGRLLAPAIVKGVIEELAARRASEAEAKAELARIQAVLNPSTGVSA